MTILKKTFLFCLTICALIAHSSYATSHPTFVLVHGALFTGQAWLPVQTYLRQQGYKSITLNTPGRLQDGIDPQHATLPVAVTQLCHLINQQPEPVILVGHNQGGAIITQAIASCKEKIKSLVYLAAVVPWPGERPFDQLSNQDNNNFDRIAPLDMTTGLSIPNPSAPIQSLLMADASNQIAETTIQQLVPEPIIFAYDILDYDLEILQHIPQYYLKTTQDKIISPESQDKFITRQNIQNVTSLDTGHCPFITQPQFLGDLLIDIAQK